MKKSGSEKNFISCVVYLDSAESIDETRRFIEKISTILNGLVEHYELIFVDDECGTEYISQVKDMKKSMPDIPVTILHMSYYQGMEVSMNAGRDLAIGDYVIEFDECNSHFPDGIIEDMYLQCIDDADIVTCSDDSKKRWTSELFYVLFNRYSASPYKLHSENFRILSRRSINRIQALSRSIPYRKALYYESGLNVEALYYSSEMAADYSQDKRVRKSRRNLAIDSLVLFTDIGYKIALMISTIMAIIAGMFAVYALVIYLRGIAIEGWTTTVLFLAFAFFGLFVLISIMIKYLSLILNMSFKKNRYLFQSVEKL